MILIVFAFSQGCQQSESELFQKQTLNASELADMLKNNSSFTTLAVSTKKFIEGVKSNYANLSNEEKENIKNINSKYAPSDLLNASQSEKNSLLKLNPSNSLYKDFTDLSYDLALKYNFNKTDLVNLLVENTDTSVQSSNARIGRCDMGYCDHISISAYYNAMSAGMNESHAYLYGAGVYAGCLSGCQW